MPGAKRHPNLYGRPLDRQDPADVYFGGNDLGWQQREPFFVHQWQVKGEQATQRMLIDTLPVDDRFDRCQTRLSGNRNT
jgi:hypothetical protein